MQCYILDLGQHQIFNTVADTLEWCGSGEYHIPSSEECDVDLQTVKSVCKDLGVPLASEKQADLSTCIEFLGIIIDTVKQELQLPMDKLDRVLRAVQQWHAHESCAKRELEYLIGNLHHACTVVCPGFSFL